jgi:hypothetical protein
VAGFQVNLCSVHRYTSHCQACATQIHCCYMQSLCIMIPRSHWQLLQLSPAQSVPANMRAGLPMPCAACRTQVISWASSCLLLADNICRFI